MRKLVRSVAGPTVPVGRPRPPHQGKPAAGGLTPEARPIPGADNGPGPSRLRAPSDVSSLTVEAHPEGCGIVERQS